MAYDPEARRQSNAALIIGLVALVIIGGAAIAYFAMKPNPEPGPTTVIQGPTKTVVVNNTVSVPVAVPAPTTVTNTVVVQQPPVTTTTRIERNTTTVRDRVVAPPPASRTTTPSTNVTINNAPPANTTTGTATDSTASNAAPAATSSATGNAAPGY